MVHLVFTRSGGGWRRLLSLLLLVTNSPCLGLYFTYFAEVKADGAGAKGVCLRAASILFIGSAEAADKSVEATPRLA